VIKPRHLVLLLLTSIGLSIPAFADTYSITFTPEAGSTGGPIAAPGTFTSGPVTIDWGPDVFTLSSGDISEMLSDCAPLAAAPKACAGYSASDAGLYEPKLNVGPLLGIDDNGGSQTSFTLVASSADSICAFQGCSSVGVLSISDLSLAGALAVPEPGTLAMLLPWLLILILVLGTKRPHEPATSKGLQS
jgi:hypothetical protein